MDKSALLSLEKVSTIYKYGDEHLRAVDDLSLTLYQGEILSVVGESGSGKSSLIHLLTGLLHPAEGRVLYAGEPLRVNRQHWKNVQAVFQDPFAAFNSFHTIEQHLLEALSLRDQSGSFEERLALLDEALTMVGLNPRSVLHSHAQNLSGGELQRVLLARIFLIRPSVLLADEPTSMVDASRRREVLDLLQKLRTSFGVSILFITHDLALSHYLSDRVAVMNKGQIVEEGSVEDVFHRTAHPYTRKLLFDIPSMEAGWLDTTLRRQ